MKGAGSLIAFGRNPASAARGNHFGTCLSILLALFIAGMPARAYGDEVQAVPLPDRLPAVQRLTHDGHLKQRPVASADGRHLLFARHGLETIQLILFTRETAQEQRLTDRRDPEFDGVFSPGGQHVAFSFDKTSPNQGDMDVYRLDRATGELVPVAASAGSLSHEEWPTWSPQGDRIAFSSTREGNQEVFIVPVHGGEWTRLTSQPGIDAHPAWSPDGRTIAFSTDRWGDLEIALISPDGTNLRRLTSSRGLDDYPAWSPTGDVLAWTTNRNGSLDIALYDLNGQRTSVLTEPGTIESFPGWTPEGRLLLTSDRDDGFEVYMTEEPLAPAMVLPLP